MGVLAAHTLEDKVLCGPLFIILCELHSFLLSCFRRLIGTSMCCQHIHACEWTPKKDVVIPLAWWSLELFITGVKATGIVSWMATAASAPLFIHAFERKTSMKTAVFLLIPLPVIGQAGPFPCCPSGGAACVSISNRTAASITTPGGPS